MEKGERKEVGGALEFLGMASIVRKMEEPTRLLLKGEVGSRFWVLLLC